VWQKFCRSTVLDDKHCMTKSTDFYRSSHCIMESTRRGVGKGQEGLETSRQHGNALLGVRYQEEI